MSTFSLVLLVVGLFLVAYAVAMIFSRRAGEGGHRRETLGCGFTLLAALVWGVALGRYLGNWSAGMRLGIACALVLPALATLVQPRRGRVLASAVLLTFAVILGASAVPVLWVRVRPPRPAAAVQEAKSARKQLQQIIEDNEQKIADTQQHLATLADDRARLRRDVRALGYSNFDTISSNPGGLSLLQELAEVERLEAEKAFLRQLNLTEAEACQLKVVITTPMFANPAESGINYPLSFCP